MGKAEDTPQAGAPDQGTPPKQDFSRADNGSTIASLFGFPVLNNQKPQVKPVEEEKEDVEAQDGGIQPPEETEETTETETDETETDGKSFDNEDKRSAYWQSQHDKLMQDYRALAAEVAHMQGQGGNVEPEDDFVIPPPPEAPTLPTDYSLSDAYNNPESSSARYHLAKEKFDIEMQKWQTQRSELSEAALKKEIDKYREQQAETSRKQQERQVMEQRYGQYIAQIEAEYGKKFNLNKEDAVKIVQDMSQPEAYNLDNVVTLWMIKNGKHPLQRKQTAPQRGKPTESPTMKQTRKAQSVPPTMGVQPAASEREDDSGIGKSLLDIVIQRGNDGIKF